MKVSSNTARHLSIELLLEHFPSIGAHGEYLVRQLALTLCIQHFNSSRCVTWYADEDSVSGKQTSSIA